MAIMTGSSSSYYKETIKSIVISTLCISLFESFKITISTSVRYIGPWDVFVISVALFFAYLIIWAAVMFPAAFLLKSFLQKRDMPEGSLTTVLCSVALFFYELFWIVYRSAHEGLTVTSYGAFFPLAQLVLAGIIAYAVFHLAEFLRNKWHLKQLGLKLFSIWMTVLAYMMLNIYFKSSFEEGYNSLYSVLLFVLFLAVYKILAALFRNFRLRSTMSALLLILTRAKLFIIMSVSTVLLLGFAYYGMAKKTGLSSNMNVLLISIDTLRADHLSCYSDIRGKTSPNIDRLAQSGYIFSNAYSPTTWTLPGHASMMTGLFPSSHKADRSLRQTLSRPVDPLSPSVLTLAEILREKGYQTAGIISNPFISRSFGMDQGFEFYDDQVDFFEDVRYLSLKDESMLFKLLQILKIIDSNDYDGERRAVEVNEEAFKWLKDNKDKKEPFFLFLHYNDPHFKYEPPSPYNKNSDGRELPYFDDIARLNKGEFTLSSSSLKDVLDLYDGEITYLDHYLGLLFKRLDDWHLLENTVLIITSDHGESFNEHEVWQHGNSLYEEQIRVPLIIYCPELKSGGRTINKDIVQTVDLTPTVLDLLNIPVPGNIQGRSLVPLLKGEMEHNFNLAFAEIRPDINWKAQNPKYGIGIRAVIHNEWKYIQSDDGKEELYNLRDDYNENINLMYKEREKADEIRKILNSWSSAVTLNNGEKQEKIDSGRLEQLRSLGYLK